MAIKKLNIGVFITNEMQSGGGFNYEQTVLKLLSKYNDEHFNIVLYLVGKRNSENENFYGLPKKTIKNNIINYLHRSLLSYKITRRLLYAVGLGLVSLEQELIADGIDLVYFLSPNEISLQLSNVPFIITLWDLGHLSNVEFPEVSNNHEFETRELLYSRCLKRAVCINVDSEYGKRYACKKYNLDEQRVNVLPFLPSLPDVHDSKVDIKKKYVLKHDFIFYPAQFWAHKNHIYILKAIKILKEEHNTCLDVVFCGSDKGNLDYILGKAKEFSIEDLVHYIGFAPSEEFPSLYRQSLSLVMPTYLGPTNIPPLEAFFYKTPVCYSDLPCFREQVGDAAFFIDLNNPGSLVNQLQVIISNHELVENVISEGTRLLEQWTEIDFYKKLAGIFDNYNYIRDCWK